MITFDDLNNQNQKISELAKVLTALIQEREVCDTQITCDLFFEYVDKVKDHLDVEERELYKELLTHSDSNVKNTASKFLSSSSEIKRLFKQYVKRWCRNKTLRIKDHQLFIDESLDMFNIVLERIVDETENLYPILRDVYGVRMAA
ncbi:MAG: hypothetical protein HQL46_08065 [Gammaproteobacteria bacterium]|nr:hypothetical protein [Gammaproteobacteria bacterium]